MIKSASFLFLFLILRPWLNAAEATDLGYNLSYVRIHSLADAVSSLPATLSAKNALVLDLRYPTASDESIAVLRSSLAGHPVDSPLFILVSPSTPAGVMEVLGASSARLITLGTEGSTPSPKIIVKTEVETDRRAYYALDAGTPLQELISGKIEKDRYDEATLVHEFKEGNVEPAFPLPPDPTKPKTPPSSDKPTSPAAVVSEPLKDQVLQRALHLHQALLALRK